MSLQRFRELLTAWMSRRHGNDAPKSLNQIALVPTASDDHVPRARSGHRVLCTGAYLYCVGGFNPELAEENNNAEHNNEEEIQLRPVLREVWRLNLLTEKWERVVTKGTFPKTMASFSMIFHESSILIFGGTSVPFSNTACNSIYLLPLKAPHKHEWMRVRGAGEQPQKGYGQSIVRNSADDCLYVAGGTSGFIYFMDVHKFTFAPQQKLLGMWHRLEVNSSRAAEGRYRHECILYNEILYIIGGGTRENVMNLKDVDAFNLRTNVWTVVPTLAPEGIWPGPRRCHAVVTHNNMAYVIGGFDGEMVFGDIWELNLNSLEWRRLPTNLPEPSYFHSAAVTADGCIYVFGGVLDQFGQRRSNKLFKMWIQPPSLKLSCMRKLLEICPDMAKHDPVDLLTAGIPINYVKWLRDKDESVSAA